MTLAGKISLGLWGLVSLLLTVMLFNAIGTVAIPVFILIWAILLLQLRPNSLRDTIAQPLKWLRQRTVLFVVLVITYCFAVILIWLVLDQPAVAKPITPRQQVLLLGGLWGLLFLLGFGDYPQTQQSQQIERWMGPIISVTTVLLVVLLVEFWMRYFLAMPDGIDATHMHQNWIRVNGFLEPRNELGYRDYPLPESLPDGVEQILVVGDSFAAGQGTAHIDDIFTRQLAQRLPDGLYQVNLAAYPGAHTAEELDLLREHPLSPPDIIVLSYFINDVLNAAEGADQVIDAGQFILPENPALLWLIENTHLGNFIYWRTVYPRFVSWRGSYIDQYLAAYQDADVWTIHQAELQGFIDYAAENDSQLVVLVWPYLNDVERVRAGTDQIEAFFTEQDIPVISMRQNLSGVDPALLVASPFDSHPSVYAHERAGEALAQTILNLQ